MLKEVKPEDLNENAIRLIGTDWMLVTAGRMGDFNTMTAAWGGLGYLWHMPVAYIFIRPQRYTYKFTEKNDHFTLSFFSEEHRGILDLCGACSGRDTDKIKETGLKPYGYGGNAVFFEQSRLTLICRKVYHHDLDPSAFLDAEIHKVYPLKDYHRMYFGEIIKALVKTE